MPCPIAINQKAHGKSAVLQLPASEYFMLHDSPSFMLLCCWSVVSVLLAYGITPATLKGG